jgi:hypothetical protein
LQGEKGVGRFLDLSSLLSLLLLLGRLITITLGFEVLVIHGHGLFNLGA